MLIGDLKILLDSTNSGINSKEISEFLAIEYNSKSISSLCSYSGDNEFVLIPGNRKFDSFNKPSIKVMLENGASPPQVPIFSDLSLNST